MSPRLPLGLLIVLACVLALTHAQFYTGGRALPKLGKRHQQQDGRDSSSSNSGSKTLEREQGEERGLSGEQRVQTRLAYGKLRLPQWPGAFSPLYHKQKTVGFLNNNDDGGQMRR